MQRSQLSDPSPTAPVADALDRDCLRAVALRDQRAFEQLYRRHHRRLARFLRRFTGRQDLIDDVVNEAMWVVWRNASEFRGDAKVSTWITGIAYRCMLKAFRGISPKDELGEASLDAAQRAALLAAYTDPAPERESRDWVACGLQALPQDQRATIELAYFVGHSCEEIALVMGCAVGTVKARLFHARVRLRSSLTVLGRLQASAGDLANGSGE